MTTVAETANQTIYYVSLVKCPKEKCGRYMTMQELEEECYKCLTCKRKMVNVMMSTRVLTSSPKKELTCIKLVNGVLCQKPGHAFHTINLDGEVLEGVFCQKCYKTI